MGGRLTWKFRKSVRSFIILSFIKSKCLAWLTFLMVFGLLFVTETSILLTLLEIAITVVAVKVLMVSPLVVWHLTTKHSQLVMIYSKHLQVVLRPVYLSGTGKPEFLLWAMFCSMLKKRRWRASEDRSIKLISTEGKIKRFKRPVYVKEMVEEYTHHVIFHADNMKCLETNVLNPPLDNTSELQPGQLYNVIPRLSVGSRLEELKENSNSDSEIISTSSIHGSPALPVRLLMRKGDATSFLNSNNINFAYKFVPKGVPSIAMGQHINSRYGFASEWKRNLDVMLELNSAQARN